jgi:dTDP-4-amino-4,6-dideoxygalactose transaminase
MPVSVSTKTRLAIDGGEPVRDTFLPFARSHVTEREISEVAETLRSGWLATGPKTAEFERRFAHYVGQRHAVGVTSGTAALGLALEVAGVGPGDEVITTPLTFVATAHAILDRGATPVFADIDREAWNLDPAEVERRITERTKAVLPVHFAGRASRVEALRDLACTYDLTLVSDSAHAIEARYAKRKLATWFPLSAFSFHPVKNLTTGEGGMVTTDDEEWFSRLRLLRLHGVATDAWSRHAGRGGSANDVVMVGHKCNMSDIQASLGLHQLAVLDQRLARREQLWRIYDDCLTEVEGIVRPSAVPPGDRHACHLYCILLDLDRLCVGRDRFRAALRAENVGTGYHYRALHQTTYYRQRLGLADCDLPNSSFVSDRIVTLPLYPTMSDGDAYSVVEAVRKVVESAR